MVFYPLINSRVTYFAVFSGGIINSSRQVSRFWWGNRPKRCAKLVPFLNLYGPFKFQHRRTFLSVSFCLVRLPSLLPVAFLPLNYRAAPCLCLHACAHVSIWCGHVSLSWPFMQMYCEMWEPAEWDMKWNCRNTRLFPSSHVDKNRSGCFQQEALLYVPFCPLVYISFYCLNNPFLLLLAQTPTIQATLPYCWNLSPL